MGSDMRVYYLKSVLLLCVLSSSTRGICSQSTAVLDIDGREIQTGSKYIILASQDTNGGGLALAPKDRPCPLYVTEENLEGYNGLPVKFMPADARQQLITLSSDVNVVFYTATICVQSTAWKLGSVDETTGRRYVVSGGATGRPGADTVSSWFRVEKQGSGNAYRLVFCPGVCSACRVACGNVGVFNENGKRWLGLTDEPLAVRFKKV